MTLFPIKEMKKSLICHIVIGLVGQMLMQCCVFVFRWFAGCFVLCRGGAGPLPLFKGGIMERVLQKFS
jgi:hypothetical protein